MMISENSIIRKSGNLIMSVIDKEAVILGIEDGMYVGSSFDEGKLADYKKEVQSRISLANTFSNFIDGVRANVQKW